MTQDEVADAVGIGRSHYSKIENAAGVASPAVAKKLAVFFGGRLTRDQILYPEEYVAKGGRKPVQSQRLQEA